MLLGPGRRDVGGWGAVLVDWGKGGEVWVDLQHASQLLAEGLDLGGGLEVCSVNAVQDAGLLAARHPVPILRASL